MEAEELIPLRPDVIGRLLQSPPKTPPLLLGPESPFFQ